MRVLGELRRRLPEDGRVASLSRYPSTWQGRQGWGRGLPQPLPEHVAGASGLGAWPPSGITRARGRGVRAGGVASLRRYLSTWQGPQGWGRGLPQPLPEHVAGESGLGAWLPEHVAGASGLGAWPPSGVT